MNKIVIDKKKYIIIPEKEYIFLKKKASQKSATSKILSLSDGKTVAYKMIEKWAKTGK